MPSLSQGDQLTALPRITSSCPVTVPGLSQPPPRETPALQLGQGELPYQGRGAAGEVQEEQGQGADPQDSVKKEWEQSTLVSLGEDIWVQLICFV